MKIFRLSVHLLALGMFAYDDGLHFLRAVESIPMEWIDTLCILTNFGMDAIEIGELNLV